MQQIPQLHCDTAAPTTAMPFTSSTQPWGKPGDEATTSTVLRVIARFTAAPLSLQSFPTRSCRQ